MRKYQKDDLVLNKLQGGEWREMEENYILKG